MNYTLDTDAIRKRFAEAIVINWCGDRTDILIPYEYGYINLSTGSPWYDVILRDVNWIIRPGDRAMVGRRDTVVIFHGFSGCPDEPFSFSYVSEVGIRRQADNIRPLPEPVVEVNPELEQARLRIKNAERELSEARAALERAQK